LRDPGEQRRHLMEKLEQVRDVHTVAREAN
jgi:hypothetical protein